MAKCDEDTLRKELESHLRWVGIFADNVNHNVQGLKVALARKLSSSSVDDMRGALASLLSAARDINGHGEDIGLCIGMLEDCKPAPFMVPSTRPDIQDALKRAGIEIEVFNG